MVNKFKSTFALTAILVVTVLLAGCIGGGTKTFTLTVNVDPEGAAAVSGVADKYDEKAVAQFTLEVAEGYEFVEWTGDDKPVYDDEDEVWKIPMDGDKTLTAVFKEIEEDPVDPDPVDPDPVADEEAAAAVDAQIMALDKEAGLVQYKSDVAAARAAYEALNAETKALVTKLVFLEAHEDQLEELLYGEVTEFVIAEKVMDGIDLTSDVLEDITLGSNFTYDGTVYQVTWESDNPEIIGVDGTVNRPYGDDVEVTLTATLDFIGTLSADQKNVFEIKLNVVGIRFDLAVENGKVTAALNDLTGLDAVTADDFAIEFAVADEAVEAKDLKVEYKDGVATWTFTPFERELDDYDVDIVVVFSELEEEGTIELEGLALLVKSVSVIDATTLLVTFDGMDAVEVTLDEALVHGQTEVTFVYDEIDYTFELEEAYADPAVVALEEATAAVVKAEDSLLDADLAEAVELVGALEASEAKTLLQARNEAVQAKIDKIVAAVNAADTEVKLYNALNVKPFVEVDVEKIKDYHTEISGKNLGTIAAIQAIIDEVNSKPVYEALGKLAQDAIDAVKAAEVNPTGKDEKVLLVDKAQTAIDALPETFTEEEIKALAALEPPVTVTATTKADLQKRLDDVKLVVPVLEAQNQIELLAALRASGFKGVNEDFIAEYEEKIEKDKDFTIKAIQEKIDGVNDKKAAEAVDELITALPDDLTLEDKEQVEAARAAYKALTEEQQELVSHLDTLETAESEIKKLEDAAKLKELKQEAEAAIKALPELKEITLANEEEVKAARALVEAAKKLNVEVEIEGIADLSEAEGKIKVLLEAEAIKTVNAANTADGLLAALKDKNLAINNIVERNSELYFAEFTAKKKDPAFKFEDIGGIETFVNDANATFVGKVNGATSVSDMKAALETSESGLDLAVYNQLGDLEKNLVAKKLRDDGTQFVDVETIQAELDIAIEEYL